MDYSCEFLWLFVYFVQGCKFAYNRVTMSLPDFQISRVECSGFRSFTSQGVDIHRVHLFSANFDLHNAFGLASWSANVFGCFLVKIDFFVAGVSCRSSQAVWMLSGHNQWVYLGGSVTGFGSRRSLTSQAGARKFLQQKPAA